MELMVEQKMTVGEHPLKYLLTNMGTYQLSPKLLISTLQHSVNTKTSLFFGFYGLMIYFQDNSTQVTAKV